MIERNTWRVVFANEDAAEKYLEQRGFSVGRIQRDENRGILLGDFDIQKWRNLSRRDRSELDGVMRRTPVGAAAITIFAAASEAAHAAIRQREPLPAKATGPDEVAEQGLAPASTPLLTPES